LMGNGATHELGLVDHGREDEFWTSDAFVECSAVEFLVWGRGGIGWEGGWGWGAGRCWGGFVRRDSVWIGEWHYASNGWSLGSSPQPRISYQESQIRKAMDVVAVVTSESWSVKTRKYLLRLLTRTQPCSKGWGEATKAGPWLRRFMVTKGLG